MTTLGDVATDATTAFLEEVSLYPKFEDKT